MRIIDKEVKNGRFIETIYLMEGFQQEHPDYEFYFVMGTDLIEGLHLWDNEGDRLINQVKFLIFERHGFD